MKKSIYIFNDGNLKRKDNTIYFQSGDNKKYLPIENIKEIFIFGEVSVSKKILEYLTQKQIIAHFFNYYEYYIGSFYPREHYNSGYMILNQTKYYMDESKRYKLASSFVKGASNNIRKVLMYYNSRGKNVDSYIEKIEELTESIQDYEDIFKLMAIEGNIREHYYKAFDEIVQNDMFRFDKRTKQPPENPINSMISFGNTLMYTVVLSEIYKTHLDPRIGYLHTTNFRRFSLNLDVAEIFKPIIIDRIIFSLIGKRTITEKDFDKQMGGILLNDSGRKKFITAFEEKLESTIKHKKINRNVSYRRLIRMELYKLEKHLMDEEDLTYVKGTTVMSSKEGNKQGTFTEKYILPYALIAFHGVLNERAAENQSLNLTEEDVNKMIKGLWYGTKNLMSNSKMGHMPRLLIEVEYNEKFFHIGELDKLITYVSDKEDIKIRDIKDGYIEVSSIIDKFNTYSDKIKSIRVMKNDRVIIKYNGEDIDLINKLKEININVENIEC